MAGSAGDSLRVVRAVSEAFTAEDLREAVFMAEAVAGANRLELT